MKSEQRFGIITRRPIKTVTAALMGASSLFGVSAGAAQAPETRYAFTAQGNIQCEDGAPVTGVWVDSYPDSGWATHTLKKLGSTTFYHYSKGTNDPWYTVHVGCGGTPKNWGQTDYSNIETDIHRNSFLCYTSPNPDQILPDRCVKDPAINVAA